MFNRHKNARCVPSGWAAGRRLTGAAVSHWALV